VPIALKYGSLKLLEPLGNAVTQLVEALRYKPEGREFDSSMFSLEFFIEIILPSALWSWG
jgi:hypothetical protein